MLPSTPPELSREFAVTRDVTDVEQRGGGVDVVVGERQRLFDRASAMAGNEPCVPQRVPQTFG